MEEKKFKTIWDIKENEKVAVLDLDDILGESIEHWIFFANKATRNHFKDLNELKKGLSYKKYKELKTYYRECGEKINIPLMKYAKKFVDTLKERNYIVIILTRRPLNIHKKLFGLTKKWLDKNKIDYDCLMFEDKKHLKIMSDIENITFFVEDNRYIANSIAHFGINCFLLNNQYNGGELNKNVTRVNTLLEILSFIK
jgi:uncharacterized HAD superfamily protein